MKKKLTAAELMARLNADPDYVARKKAQDEEFRLKEEEYSRAEAPLVQALRSAGSIVNSVWDFVNGKVEAASHTKALPILLTHLEHQYPDAIRDGIARAMAIPAAKFAWRSLTKLYAEEKGRRTKDGLAVALANVVDDETLDELIAFAGDPQHGESRLLLLNALERSHLPKARKALMDLGGDPALHKEVQRILRRKKRART
jgi:hypothetical protein